MAVATGTSANGVAQQQCILIFGAPSPSRRPPHLVVALHRRASSNAGGHCEARVVTGCASALLVPLRARELVKRALEDALDVAVGDEEEGAIVGRREQNLAINAHIEFVEGAHE